MFKKGFHIDLEESLTYPSTKVICSCIEKYAKSTGEKLVFINTQKPITFHLNDIPYIAEVSMIRGGYYIHCKEN
ncbi:DUF4318 domain-containing protein [Lacrimispora indolis]|uniref:DUF4318 domain-containing protein n=1 Tax=Lacrimispora indolis TaxID=69825 RepID=UPI00045EBC38